MQGNGPDSDGEEGFTGHTPDSRPMLAGIQVREEDLEPQKGLDIASMLFRIAAVVILVLALGQFFAWWVNQPPGGAGVGLLIGDTIRLIVFAGLLWAAGDLASLAIKTHYDIRAARILLARQTYMMRQMAEARGEVDLSSSDGFRRQDDPVETGSGAS